MGLRKSYICLIIPILLSSCAAIPQKQPSPCGTWIELVNQQDEIATIETAGRWEIIWQCVELSQYFRLSEKAGEWLINKQVGHVEATDLEREYVAYRVAYFYIQALQSHDPKVRRQELIEGANVAWRRIAGMPDAHAFAELSLIRLRELCGEIGYDVEYPVAVPVPPGMGRWAFVRPSQGAAEVGDFSEPYGETVFARRPPILLYPQTVACFFSLFLWCPVEFDDHLAIQALRHPLALLVLDRVGRPVSMPNMQRFVYREDGTLRTFH